MTISTTTTLNRYTGNGSTTVFPYTFRILAAADLVVTKLLSGTLVPLTLAYPADYSVSGVGNATGGSITLTVTPATGDLIVIERVMPITQSTSIRNNSSYFAETHENVFDRGTMVDQQQATALGRTFSLPKTIDPATMSMSLPVPVAGQVLTWTPTGLTNATVTNPNVVLPGEGRDTTTLTQYLANNFVYNVLDYNADPTGAVDSTAAINQALLNAGGNAIAATEGAANPVGGASGGVSDSGSPLTTVGGAVFLPRGKYMISGPLYVPNNCVLYGIGRGSQIYHTGTGSAIKYVRNAATDGYAAGVVLQNFLIDGTNNGTSQHGIECRYATLGIIQNVIVENCGGNGVWLNEHTVAMQLYNVRCMDNGLAQLFLDGISGSSYANCDSHVIVGGRFFCNTRGQYSIRLRRTIDTAIYHPIIEGSVATNNTGLRIEGSETLHVHGCFAEGHGTHLSIVADSVTAKRARKIRFYGGDWQGGANTKMTVSIDGSEEVSVDAVNWDAPPANVASSIITVGVDAIDTVIRGRCERMGLTDSGKNTRFVDDITDAKGWDGVPISNTNFVGFGSQLASGGWTVGANIVSRTEGTAGPVPGISATRIVAGIGAANYVQYPTASVSLNQRHAISFWAKSVSGTQYMGCRISVPGIGDEIDVPISLGTSWKRYVVIGPKGALTPGNMAVTLYFPNSATVDVAGVKAEIGSPTPYIHTFQNATQSGQAGDEFPMGRIIRRTANLTDGATVAIDAAGADVWLWSANGSRTVSAPTNAVTGAWFDIQLKNVTVGAITTTWNAVFKFAGAWVDPATTKTRIVQFRYDGTNWIEARRSPADI